MSLFAPRTSSAIPVEKTPAPAQCVACKRTAPTVTLERRVLDGGSVEFCCVNPTECKRHWLAES